MIKTTLLNIPLNFYSKDDILENILKSHLKKRSFKHVISINAENLIEAVHSRVFKDVVIASQIHIADGAGIVLAAQILSANFVPRCTGVDLMKALCEVAYNDSLSVMLIGGKPNLAKRIAECQNGSRANINFYGYEGYKNKANPAEQEEKQLISIVAARKPSLIFVAFGSPFQEIWIDRHKSLFSGALCMGVGGAFDFLSGDVKRAPRIMQSVGLEWLFRLVREPWRWRRQLRLLEFVGRVIMKKIIW